MDSIREGRRHRRRRVRRRTIRPRVSSRLPRLITTRRSPTTRVTSSSRISTSSARRLSRTRRPSLRGRCFLFRYIYSIFYLHLRYSYFFEQASKKSHTQNKNWMKNLSALFSSICFWISTDWKILSLKNAF